jgi:hypothetical protein
MTHSTVDPTFAFVGGLFCPTLDFVIAFWIILYPLSGLFVGQRSAKDSFLNKKFWACQ